MNSKTGVLHVVATPIGNLGDLSSRARETLQQADLVLAEDTRRTGVLMRHFNLGTPLSSFHDHNERQQVPEVLRRLSAGENIALVSDAGTPLISDPGYSLVSAAREQGFTVSPVPGPCALVAALSASGLPVDRFVFEGFVPARKGARQALLDRVAVEERTVVLYESSHRILETLEDMSSVLGPDRAVVIGREISKRFETFYRGDSVDVLEQLRAGTEHQYGEFVVMVEGAPVQDADEVMLRKLLQLLLDELPVKTASRIAAAWSGAGRNRVYALALDLGKSSGPNPE